MPAIDFRLTQAAATGNKWHLDEVVLTIVGVKDRLWRAIDQTGMALDTQVRGRRDTWVAKRLLCKLMRGNAGHRASWSGTSWPVTVRPSVRLCPPSNTENTRGQRTRSLCMVAVGGHDVAAPPFGLQVVLSH